ncbi:hypothetical protein PUMCH_004417 [Australozyma saopauloensis]|uniref:SCA7 domain-containing protein n=1 Tax=Australozyma saopauloensis TaxID=291208 RepID=A0AAX4HF68_9ASCO|nr:hypothetical protein PUMCH_004417 [[Candida] saopauloensis]
MSSGRNALTTRTITLDQVQHLGLSSEEASVSKKKSIIWKDFGVYLDKKLDWHLDQDFVENASASPTVILNVLSDSSYLSQVVKFQICNSCKRPVGEDTIKTHYTRCVEMKQKRLEQEGTTSSVALKKKRGRAGNSLLDVENSSVNSSRGATPAPTSPTSTSSGAIGRPKKKYKKSQMQKEKEAANAAAAAALAAEAAANRAQNATATKKKKSVKPKPVTVNKSKGPVDVEKQCGVALSLGGFCARSLTCKTHPMGAKRAVPGRSAPYDVLLQRYQKRNQAKLAATNALAAQRREDAQLSGVTIDDDDGAMNIVLDPDEETQLVLEGLSKNSPCPLERKVMVSVKHRHRFLYMREAYANALITNGPASADALSLSADLKLANQAISGSMGGLQGRCALVSVDRASEGSTQSYATIAGELYSVRAPLKAVTMTAQYNQHQQQVFQQQVLKLQQQQLLMRQRQQQQQQQQLQTQKA